MSMSSTGDIGSSNNLSSVEKCTPKFVRHLESLLWEFPFSVQKWEIGKYRKFSPISVVPIDRDAVLKIQRTSEEIVSVNCSIRERMDDDGCFLRIYFTLIGVKEETKSAEIRFPDTCATVEYKVASFSTLAVNENYRYCMKCVFRLIETSYLSQEKCFSLDRAFHDAIKKHSESDGQLKDMSYILGRSSLDHIFTGRETRKDVSRKTRCIKRAFRYAKMLARYLKAREKSGSRLPKIPIGEILGHICRRKKSISVIDWGWLFVCANRLGLTFLKKLCTDYILANLDNDVVVDALSAALEVEDEFLFEAASDFFIKNRQDVLESSTWEKMIDEKRVIVRCIAHRLYLLIHSREFMTPPMLEDESSGEE